uniref:Vacuolar protein sorting-associated protein 35 n=1 Tax=Lygus hesperus TaxID=30085 RepID=A0A0A9WB17_LYGHE
MCKGVQNPLRGLFVRNYLCLKMKQVGTGEWDVGGGAGATNGIGNRDRDGVCSGHGGTSGAHQYTGPHECEPAHEHECQHGGGDTVTTNRGKDGENEIVVREKDAIAFWIENFTEMNKLWLRMQYVGTVGSQSQRE